MPVASKHQAKTWRKFVILLWILFLLCLPLPGCQDRHVFGGVQPPRTYAVWEMLVPLVSYPIFLVFTPLGVSSLAFVCSPIYPELFSAATRTVYELKAWFARVALLAIWLPPFLGALTRQPRNDDLQIGYFCLAGVYTFTSLASCYLQFDGPRPGLVEYDHRLRPLEPTTGPPSDANPPPA